MLSVGLGKAAVVLVAFLITGKRKMFGFRGGLRPRLHLETLLPHFFAHPRRPEPEWYWVWGESFGSRGAGILCPAAACYSTVI